MRQDSGTASTGPRADCSVGLLGASPAPKPLTTSCSTDQRSRVSTSRASDRAPPGDRCGPRILTALAIRSRLHCKDLASRSM